MRLPLPTAEQIAELAPDGGSEFNRLVFEHSPYLLQHARNPVDWYPWGEEAFQLAREQDKPVFLSIGYSTCHWCHVMEHESFEDDEVAELMNREFVCIKVDREERPDIDQVYMTVTQAMTGHGGWPMTVVMTPDKKPFFAGTYFPKTGRMGRSGMMELVPALGQAWRDQRAKVLESAENATSALAQWTSGTPGPDLQSTLLDATYKQFAGSFDSTYGGFGEAPKFPVPHNLSFLLRYHLREPDSSALTMVERTLAEMRKGGIWDHVGFGFHRYSTDPHWLVPHFEKMLYDQAMLAMAYTEAWQLSGEDEYRRTADEIFTYVQRDMTAPEGGFYSAEDADSEGVEGLFYVWSTAELKEVLGAEDGRFAAEIWNCEVDGNFTDEAAGSKTGTNILHLQASLAELARKHATTEEALRQRIGSMRARLFDVREKRIHPLKDDKILTDWNGLMIAAFAKAGCAMDEARYTDVARRAADFVLATLRDENGRLFKRYRRGNAALPAMIEDYAFLTWGLLELYEATGDVPYLQAAIELTETALARFWDDEQGGFFTAPDDGEGLIVRAKEAYDGAIPSGNSVMALNLLRLGRVTARGEFEERAQSTMRAFSGGVQRAPRGHAVMLAALDFMVGPTFEIVVAGDPAAGDTQAMLAALHRRYLPNKVVVMRANDGTAVAALAPYAEAQTAQDGKATAYVCRNYACQAPTTEIETMLEYLEAAQE